jgi:redox-sensitive bicupin YhaK (pirin superfamily)
LTHTAKLLFPGEFIEMLEMVIDQRRRSLGGFEVGRVLPFQKRKMVGPFIFLDHMGPITFPKGIPKSTDVRPHPHIGLSTVTYLLEGEIMHRDSVGSGQAIRPGDVNWMIAGRGITHSERFERARAEGGSLHGIQAWVALPSEVEETDPAFFHHSVDALPFLNEATNSMRLIAGEAFGMRSPAQAHSRMFYVHWTLRAGAVISMPHDHRERAAFVVAGSVECSGQSYGAGQLLIFRPSAEARFRATGPAVVMGLGGEPIGTRFIDWNFVSSSKDRIEQAKSDWRAGRMKLPDLDDQEFIPLPTEPSPPAPPLSWPRAD